MPTARPASILVVEDDHDSRELVVRLLARHGFALATAADGAEALRMVTASRPDLILLDIMMPELSGLDLLFLLRQSYSREELPVIMLTACSELEDAIEALAMGANDYLTKPVDLGSLPARLRSHLELSR